MANKITDRLAQAWNDGDGAAWAACFTEDADFVDVLGRLTRGRAEISTAAEQILGTIYQGSHLEFQVLSTRELGDGLVLAHTTSMLRVPGGPRAGDTAASQTMLIRGELIVAFHNTVQISIAEFIGQG
nr:SgcJ/EcaC family oxidoreductase [Kibdelosporangium sp. MJ126-NF4]CEL16422.1 hypothetical protein [Kibdelosporangium sp. MJ126-NF4]CTQ90374.1 hypothetical protein [Kibdelosporangium sp. MJ126-NF4]